MLIGAAALTVLVGLYHSLAGERRLIRPLLALDTLPVLGGGLWYTRALIRAAWHVTTLAWFGLAAILLHAHLEPAARAPAVLWSICAVFGASGLVALVFSRGRHPAWLAFLPIAALTALAAIAT